MCYSIQQCGRHFLVAKDAGHSPKARLVVMMFDEAAEGCVSCGNQEVVDFYRSVRAEMVTDFVGAGGCFSVCHVALRFAADDGDPKDRRL